MVCKKDISLMSTEELNAYVEKVRAKRRELAAGVLLSSTSWS